METLFNAIGGLMTTIICYVVDILPIANKETIKAHVKSTTDIVGMISLVAMLVAFFVFPILGILKNKPMKRKRTTRRKRKR